MFTVGLTRKHSTVIDTRFVLVLLSFLHVFVCFVVFKTVEYFGVFVNTLMASTRRWTWNGSNHGEWSRYCFLTVFVPYLMCQDVDIMTDIAWWCRMLLLAIFALLWLFHLYLTLHVGLFDHLHLQEHSLSHKAPSTSADGTRSDMHTSSFGRMLYRILSAVSLSWRLSIIARRSLEALFCKTNRGITLSLPRIIVLRCFFARVVLKYKWTCENISV